MALINCPECNREVSDKAGACPHCGFGVAKYVERQEKIDKIHEEAEKEAYLYVIQKKKEEKEKEERKKRDEIDRKNNIYNEAIYMYESKSPKDIEKAEELFSTILGWKDSDFYLKNCKNKSDKLRQEELRQKENKRKKLKKYIIIATFLFIIVMIPVSINRYKLYQEQQRIDQVRNEFLSSIQGEYVYVHQIMDDTYHTRLTVSGENIKIMNTPGTIQGIEGDFFYVEWTYASGKTKTERFKRVEDGDGYNLIYFNSFLSENQEFIRQ